MGVVELLLISISLSMDSFAVSICKGLSMKKIKVTKCIIIASYFVFFHLLMLLFGFTLGTVFENFINTIDHWIAFVLLMIIGINMINEALSNNEDSLNDKIDLKTMLPLGLATSIDALAVGITFSVLDINILLSLCVVGIIIFIVSSVGIKIGNIFGDKYASKAQIFGGVVLMLIGLKILLEHLGII